MRWKRNPFFATDHHLSVTEAAQQAEQVFVHGNRSLAAIFRLSLPPTYACVGDRDGIASWRVMQARLDAMQQAGIDTEFHVYPGLGHGFGLGTGTSAEGWLDDAIAFWEKQME